MCWTLIEWTLFVVNIVGTFHVIKGRIKGYHYWVVGNVGLVALYTYQGLYVSALMFAVCLALAIYAIWECRKNGHRTH